MDDASSLLDCDHGGSRRSLADTSVTSTADLSVFSTVTRSQAHENSLDTHSNMSDNSLGGASSVGSGTCQFHPLVGLLSWMFQGCKSRSPALSQRPGRRPITPARMCCVFTYPTLPWRRPFLVPIMEMCQECTPARFQR